MGRPGIGSASAARRAGGPKGFEEFVAARGPRLLRIAWLLPPSAPCEPSPTPR
ncbi:hypothetical protein Strvi_6305 [Streptomyces violaceusniger Tu 4113]|uniref:Uncharacterized protein n=1 Tax=Streptomyces violaceusniger (strain Tu 4113) TaxID=653045 RepID=G2P612_STRV4|nr:hypothetical protein Strvi_6305 [Streptomyces violaceusniger Tu 4113]